MYYGKDYFEWQKNIGSFGGWANLTKFSKFIKKTDTVLDFGCGGGFLLNNIDCSVKAGIEINPFARENCEKLGIKTFVSPEQVPDDYADVIISNNALEHCERPLDILKSLYPKLKKGGTIIFVVPNDSFINSYRSNNIDHHFYSFSPMNLGNLFTEAGFCVIESKPYIHKWPPRYLLLSRFGRFVFDIVCRIYGFTHLSWVQVRCVATK